VPAYLVQHPKGRVLLDAGMGQLYRQNVDDQLPPDELGREWFEGMDIASLLRAIGGDPGDINWIMNSHLQIDHCGGNAFFFANAKMIIQAAELDKARNDPVLGFYEADDFYTAQSVKTVVGEHDLFGDSTVRIVPTYGHSPGRQNMIVRLGERELLLAGDRCYNWRNLQLMALPKATDNLDAAMVTLQRLASPRDAGTLILVGHDAFQRSKIGENTPFRQW